jgi:uncharacterized protein (DUF2267 family)
LAAQLPEELQERAHEEQPPTDDDATEFVERIATNLGDAAALQQTRTYVKAVVQTLQETVTEGEITDLRTQLPNEYQALFD